MVSISSKEAKALRKLGVRDGENGISHSHSHHKSYYLCENKKNMEKLNRLRKAN